MAWGGRLAGISRAARFFPAGGRRSGRGVRVVVVGPPTTGVGPLGHALGGGFGPGDPTGHPGRPPSRGTIFTPPGTPPLRGSQRGPTSASSAGSRRGHEITPERPLVGCPASETGPRAKWYRPWNTTPPYRYRGWPGVTVSRGSVGRRTSAPARPDGGRGSAWRRDGRSEGGRFTRGLIRGPCGCLNPPPSPLPPPVPLHQHISPDQSYNMFSIGVRSQV